MGKYMTYKAPRKCGFWCVLGNFLLALFSFALTGILLLGIFLHAQNTDNRTGAKNIALMDRYDMFITNEISSALDGILAVEKVYWLSDSDLTAPEPNPACFGQADSPAQLQWLLEEASELLDGQTMLFGPDTPAWEGSPIYYYFDETILTITWKQVIDRGIYTVSETKIAHGSQFRRFLADGTYGSSKQYITTDMAESVNAVVASSGDFYKFRLNGISIYEGQIRRMEGKYIDTCCIDDQGDLQFIYRGEIRDEAEAQRYVDENNIRFSLCFGPVLVDDGEAISTKSYPLGEVDEIYSRAALGQLDSLHYLLVTVNAEGGYIMRCTTDTLGRHMAEFGCEKAYALDGGQTAVLAMQGKTINRVDYGTQRQISDIIYFATALPGGG